MVNIIVGCAGWSYKDWVGPFYPKGLTQGRWLTHYAKYFGFTEINSTFYNLPAENAVLRWLNAVPDDFRFTAKVWRNITHKKSASSGESTVKLFLERLKPLEPKLLGYLLQFAPQFRYTEGHYKRVTEIFDQLTTEKPIFVEFRDNAWFDPEILGQFVDGDNVVLVTNYKEGVQPIYLEDQSRYYIRCIGDRELTVFNRIQRSQDHILEEVKRKLDSWERQPGIREVLVNFNNHFRGFSPQDVNEFKRGLGLPYRDFKQQHTLTEYIKAPTKKQ